MSRKANSALTLAYNCVIKLGWNHSMLRDKYRISFPTLRRIKNGVRGKVRTDEYCMKVFVFIMFKEYNRMLENGGDGCAQLNRVFRDVLLAEHDISK